MPVRRFAPLLAAALLAAPFWMLPASADPEPVYEHLSAWYADDVAVDAAGNAYLVGSPYDAETNGYDVHVRKLDPAGEEVWTRVISGSENDLASAIAVDPSGAIFVGGSTGSADFPVTPGAWQTAIGGEWDGWIAKLDAEGDVVWATYAGGSSFDVLDDLDWGPSGTVAFAGYTYSCDFPTTPGAYDATLAGSCEFEADGYVARLAADGRSAIFSTYLGGSDNDIPGGVAVSRSSGTVMVAGTTLSSDFPTTSGAFQRTLRGGQDGFVTKLSADGRALSFSTLLGGSDWDTIHAVARDAAGDAFVTGQTASTDLPVSSGAFQRQFGGGLHCGFEEDEACPDLFVARVNDGGRTLDYLTYVGSERSDFSYDLSIDADGFAYVTGGTDSPDFPVIGTTDTGMGEWGASFALAVTPDGKALAYSQVLTGHHYASAVAATAAGEAVYVGALDVEGDLRGYALKLGAPAEGVVFDARGGNEHWVEVFVGGDAAGRVTKVEARDNDTPYTALAKSPWGFYAGEVHVQDGHFVQFRATLADGTTVRSECVVWSTGVPVACPPEPTPTVSFTHGGGNEWWVEAKVEPKPASVQAMDTGGAWVNLAFKSWGEWAASFHIEPGHDVRFRATYANGTTVESCWYSHPAGVAQDCGSGGGGGNATFDATFRNVRGNEWWIETDVSVTGGTLAGVDARINGGAWHALEKKSWGSWAKSLHAPAGSTVELRARATDGSTDTSGAYSWPPA